MEKRVRAGKEKEGGGRHGGRNCCRCFSSRKMENGVVVVLGAQWGDEGKGKLIDLLAGESDLVGRCAGGSNAGHTVVVNGVNFKFHLLPSGLLNENSLAAIGNGVVVHIPGLLKEIEDVRRQGVETEPRIRLSDRAHLLFDYHKVVDGLREVERGGGKIGTTRQV